MKMGCESVGPIGGKTWNGLLLCSRLTWLSRCKASYTVAHENAHIGTALTCSLQLDRHRHEPFALTWSPSLSRRDLTSDTISLSFTAVDFVGLCPWASCLHSLILCSTLPGLLVCLHLFSI